jgi:hypothetical protein
VKFCDDSVEFIVSFLKKLFPLPFFVCLAVIASVARSPGEKLRPAMLLWNVGLSDPGGPSQLVETITPSTWQGRKTWRVTHYSQDPVSSKVNDYDLYDLDRESLDPLRSVSNREDGYLELLFSKSGVAIRSKIAGADWAEHVDLHGAVKAEGPGLTALVATLPLSLGYKLSYEIVDRWSGRDNSRLKKMTMGVTSRGVIETAMGKRDSFEVVIRPEDRSFEIRESVLAEGLHWPVRMTYIRGSAKVNSEVLAITVSER